jgi:hypothetical protein
MYAGDSGMLAEEMMLRYPRGSKGTVEFLIDSSNVS